MNSLSVEDASYLEAPIAALAEQPVEVCTREGQ